MIIYKITNKVNGKIYIGQTIKMLEERWIGHCKNKRGKLLYRAIKKYKKESFTKEELFQCDSKEELNNLEQICISYYESLVPNGYNISIGGNAPMVNRKHTKKTKQQISITMKSKDVSHLHSEESMNKRVEAFKRNGKLKGIARTEKVKRKISLANSGKNHGMFNKRGFDCPNFKCPILCVELNKIFGSQGEAARELNLHQSNINKVLLGKRKTTGGFSFINIEE